MPLLAGELELCGSRSMHGNKDQTANSWTHTSKACSKRQAATDVLPTSCNSNQQPRNRAPPSMWCVRGALRSKRPSSAGRHGRIAGGLVCSWCGYGTEDPLTAATLFSATRRQFERPAAPSDKCIVGTTGWCHDATYGSHLVGLVWLAIQRYLPPNIAWRLRPNELIVRGVPKGNSS